MTNVGAQFRWELVAIWIIAFVASLALDRPVATWVRDNIPVDKHAHRTHLVLETLKFPGWGYSTVVIVVALGIFHRRHWWAALALAVSAIGVGIVYSVVKWVVGRYRPVIDVNPWAFHPFTGGWDGFWHEKGLCFPSGHASLAFATATCLAMLMPRTRWIFFAIATLTAAERVAENAHYMSDVVGGAGLGMLVGWIATRAIVYRFSTPAI